MTNDPNVPPYPQYPGQPQPQQPPYPQQHGPAGYQPYPPQYQHEPFPQQSFGPPPPPQQRGPQTDPNRPKGPFGVSFWIVGGLLALIVLSNTITGHGESIMIFLGIAGLLTGLYSLIFKKRSWAALPGRNVAVAVAVAGGASLILGGIAAGVDGSRGQADAQPVTSAELEADAAAKLKAREDALMKSEAESAVDLAKREETVKAREAAVTGAEKAAAANTISEGIWTVGKDIVPGTYRTAKALTSSCYWSITRTGSNGGDIIENDGPKGGFPMVVLSEGQTFENNGCGDWKKQ